jgi:hypothetical protein
MYTSQTGFPIRWGRVSTFRADRDEKVGSRTKRINTYRNNKDDRHRDREGRVTVIKHRWLTFLETRIRVPPHVRIFEPLLKIPCDPLDDLPAFQPIEPLSGDRLFPEHRDMPRAGIILVGPIPTAAKTFDRNAIVHRCVASSLCIP